jgi:cation diffusion facilitator family transporter
MHSRSLEPWLHGHVFLGAAHARNERRTWFVVALTAAMMVAEIIGGIVFGSMALLADGWHMSTHAAALAIAALAYQYARRHSHDPRFAFGTGKLGDLAAFASAIALGIIALMIAYESLVRLARPVPIAYSEAIAIAAVGLAVNLLCAWLLRDERSHLHDRAGDHHGHHHHKDHNLRAAYLHVLADAVTSVLAIGGLILALSFGWPWVDAVVGLVGACVIASWSYGLIRDASRVLLDVVPMRAFTVSFASDWRSMATAWRIFTSGRSVPGIAPRSSRSSPTGRRRPPPTRTAWAGSQGSATSPSRSSLASRGRGTASKGCHAP